MPKVRLIADVTVLASGEEDGDTAVGHMEVEVADVIREFGVLHFITTEEVRVEVAMQTPNYEEINPNAFH